MRKSAVRSQEVLKEIERGFSVFRGGHDGKPRGYPKAVKDLAVSGLRQGCTPSAVARAAGVSVAAIRLWNQSMGAEDLIVQKLRPVELKVIESRPSLAVVSCDRRAADGLPLGTTEAVAHIEFRSGARMAVPVSAISERLVGLLMGSAS